MHLWLSYRYDIVVEIYNNPPIIRLKEIDSTNSYLKRLARHQPCSEESIVVADFQTGGRGQMGSGWFAEKGKNLLFSILLYPKNLPANAMFIISRIASLAVKYMVDPLVNDISIKWPNDIYWREKKIAGILIENDIRNGNIENSVIGIGINVNQLQFPVELPNPTSLALIMGEEQNLDNLLATVVREFFILYNQFEQGETEHIEDRYMSYLYRANDYYWFADSSGSFRAKIKNVQPSGHLLLEREDDGCEMRYAFKEISFVDN